MRALAYHDVSDAAAFETQLRYVKRHHEVVSADDVAAAARGQQELPAQAVWLTFDDAHPGVIRHALPLLQKHGLPATLFVCPSLLDTRRPYWWQVLDLALENGIAIEYEGRNWSDRRLVTALKQAPDPVRRRVVDEVSQRLSEHGIEQSVRQVTSDDLHRWVAAGHRVGNHSWDHPCLDTCDAEEQRDQVERAHAALLPWTRGAPLIFAYPNGNTSVEAEQTLEALGYDVAALFDHRMNRVTGRRVSRLRLDADADFHRTAAVISGAHSLVFGLRHRRTRSA